MNTSILIKNLISIHNDSQKNNKLGELIETIDNLEPDDISDIIACYYNDINKMYAIKIILMSNKIILPICPYIPSILDEISSDYQKIEILKIIRKYLTKIMTKNILIDTLETICSDNYKISAVEILLPFINQPIITMIKPIFSKISSDYYIISVSKILLMHIHQIDIDDIIKELRCITSDYYRLEYIKLILKKMNITFDNILTITKNIRSDHYIIEILKIFSNYNFIMTDLQLLELYQSVNNPNTLINITDLFFNKINTINDIDYFCQELSKITTHELYNQIVNKFKIDISISNKFQPKNTIIVDSIINDNKYINDIIHEHENINNPDVTCTKQSIIIENNTVTIIKYYSDGSLFQYTKNI
ncbi:hypothetical protein QKC54_gp0858 [Megavirus baoshan]|uniref:Uncharacterized protein n=1 Tax=Megavirus baoshan TaxID=2496520 RepID=A0A3S8UYU8_9VIRU|nr:hypothetical protein QKC54_gp0858 [Megavirus baoshan]AZL90000.1 hypothetical protein Mb0214 [Megavirus baoshan]